LVLTNYSQKEAITKRNERNTLLVKVIHSKDEVDVISGCNEQIAQVKKQCTISCVI
jgi:hypothetical protein